MRHAVAEPAISSRLYSGIAGPIPPSLSGGSSGRLSMLLVGRNGVGIRSRTRQSGRSGGSPASANEVGRSIGRGTGRRPYASLSLVPRSSSYPSLSK